MIAFSAVHQNHTIMLCLCDNGSTYNYSVGTAHIDKKRRECELHQLNYISLVNSIVKDKGT